MKSIYRKCVCTLICKTQDCNKIWCIKKRHTILKLFHAGFERKTTCQYCDLEIRTEDFIQFLFISNISISFLIYMKSQLVVQVKETSNVFITCTSWTEISTPAICLFVVVQTLFLYFYNVIASCKPFKCCIFLYHGQ